MSAAQCLCQPPDQMPARSACPSAGGQARLPPCPCTKCKDKLRERQQAQSQAIANNRSGICGQRINGVQIGKQSGIGAAPPPCVGSAPAPKYNQSCCGSMPMGPGPGLALPRPCSPPAAPPSASSDKCDCEGATQSMPVRGCQSPGMPGQKPGMMMAGQKPGMMMPGQKPLNFGSGPSNHSAGIAFGGMTLARKSSFTESGPQRDEKKFLTSPGCIGSLAFGDFAGYGYGPQGPSLDKYSGRDTFGKPIHLQGTGLLNSATSGVCPGNVLCDMDCGVDTGCTSGCHTMHKGGIGGAGGGAVGIRICSNDYVNAIITFLMEVLGILVFFAICTITFWITVGYYVVQLLIDLKNAERNVQAAVVIVFSLLIIAFAITQVTHSEQICYNKAKHVSNQIAATGSTPSCARCHKAIAQAKKVSAPKCHEHVKPKPKLKPKPKPKCQTGCSKPKPRHAAPTRRYTDCQGRAIYKRTTRHATIIEMKHPHGWIIWLYDWITRFFASA